jgi:hypothetical protein
MVECSTTGKVRQDLIGHVLNEKGMETDLWDEL